MTLDGASPAPHHFTVDVEEHFQVSAFEPYGLRPQWDRLETRVRRNVDVVLELLAEFRVRGTFFVLGWVADRHPEVVRAIAAAGHELASHGWDHRRIGDEPPEQFRASIRRTKRVLEDIAGTAVAGFRAPSFSITPGREWAFDILLEEGYRYDSSVFPVRRPGYGYPRSQRDPHWIERPAGRLLEIPLATVRRCGLTLPAAGGGYLRLFPYGLARAALIDCERRGVPATFYVHPWELDPEQPRFAVSWLTRIRHYGGLARTQPRLRRLLREFRFGAIGDRLAVYA